MLNIALNALDALIFVSTVSTFNAKHSIKCIGCFDLCIDSVNINIALNALDALIRGFTVYVDTVDTNKIQGMSILSIYAACCMQ